MIGTLLENERDSSAMIREPSWNRPGSRASHADAPKQDLRHTCG